MQLLRRDLLLLYRQPRDILNFSGFFIIVIILFPLATASDPELLANYAAGIIWIAVLLAHLLALDRLFQHDFSDGVLEQLLLSPYPLHLSICAKLLAHWFSLIVPLLLLVPLSGLLLHMSAQGILILMLSLLLGTPILTCIGALGAALTLGLRNSSALIALLVFPLYIPLLIFAVGSVLNIDTNAAVLAPLAYLGAILALAAPLSPLAIAAILRININA